MNKQTLAIIGLVGGILAAAGVFLPWASVFGFSVSGWDATATVSYPYLILVGGILALVGGLGALAKVKNIGYLMPLGGVLALVGWIWAAADIGFGNLGNMTYGFYLCLVGAVLALVGTKAAKA